MEDYHLAALENGIIGNFLKHNVEEPSMHVCVCVSECVSVSIIQQTIFSRRAKGRQRGSSTLVGGAMGGASAGFSSHSHAKFVQQLMRESRFRVS